MSGLITLGARSQTMSNVAPGSASLPIFMSYSPIAQIILRQFAYGLFQTENTKLGNSSYHLFLHIIEHFKRNVMCV